MCGRGFRRGSAEQAELPTVAEHEGRLELRVDGVVQSVDVDSAAGREYWRAMLPDRRPARALLLGAGGGTLAALLQHRFGQVPVVAVDDDPHVVALGRAKLYLALPSVQVVLADAFRFAGACPGRFDYIAVDLFHGARPPRELLGRPFLRDLARIAGRGGEISINLFRDRRIDTAIARIERVLPVSRRVETGKNVVVRCRVP
jgi:spermidine synthase